MVTAQAAEATDDESLKQNKELVSFDTVIVFGEGPIKPILLPEELTPQQYRQFDLFNSDPLKYPEPDFWLMQQPRNLAQIKKIAEQHGVSLAEKKIAIEKIRQTWQHTGWYALKRMGRQNALAAGLALYKGLTKEVILSGGRTMSAWTRKHISKQRRAAWPTEAELMAEVIKSSYGVLYEKKYGKKIEDAIRIEDASTNTLENFAYSVNMFPQLHSKDRRIGFLSAGHHMKRLKLLAQIFGISVPEHYALSSQQLLRDADEATTSDCDIIDENNCAETRQQNSREEKWIKALSDPHYVTYWLGYVAEVKKVYVLQKALSRFREKAWKEAGAVALAKVALNIEEIAEIDIELLAKTDPQKYMYIINTLQQLKNPTYRVLP